MFGKRDILSASYRVGLDQLLLRGYDAVANISGDVTRDTSGVTFEGETDGTVLFPLLPGYRTVCYRYCVLADAFRKRGYEPVLLVNDGTIDAPMGRTVDENHSSTAQANFYSRRIPEKFGLETTLLSDLLPKDAETLAGRPVADIDIERFARASVRKHHKVHQLTLERDDINASYRRFVRAGRLLAHAVSSLVSETDLVAVLAHEPYYVQGAVPMSVAKQHDVPAYSQVWGLRDGYLLFGRGCNRSPLPQYGDTTLLERELTTPLSTDERDQIDTIMQRRASGHNLAVDYAAHTDETVEAEDESTLVGVFTNLLWDASLEPEQAVYQDVFEWLEDTFDAVRGRDDITVVVKTHPAEETFGTNESVRGWVTDHGDVPANVNLLEPTTDVDTYALLDSLDTAVVYNSTVGLEAAYNGVPVIVAGDTHYRDLGLTVDVESQRAYRELLADVDSLEPDAARTTAARRYAHFLFVKEHVPFEFCHRERSTDQTLKPVDSADTDRGSEPFDTIVSAIVNDQPVLNPNHSDLLPAVQR